MFWESWETNRGLLDEKQECYLCAMSPLAIIYCCQGRRPSGRCGGWDGQLETGRSWVRILSLPILFARTCSYENFSVSSN